MLRLATARAPLWGALAILLAAQVWFTVATHKVRPAVDEMPPPMSSGALRAMALGDDEFLFRYLGRWMEYVGDGGGRVRPLREYDYDRVVGWLESLDRLDNNRSDYPAQLAAKYFGQVNISPERVRKILFYLRSVALGDIVHRWQWLIWGAHEAQFPLNDPAILAILAHDLQSPALRTAEVPGWVRLMPIQLYRLAGDQAASRAAIESSLPEDLAELERASSKYRERLRELLKPK